MHNKQIRNSENNTSITFKASYLVILNELSNTTHILDTFTFSCTHLRLFASSLKYTYTCLKGNMYVRINMKWFLYDLPTTSN